MPKASSYSIQTLALLLLTAGWSPAQSPFPLAVESTQQGRKLVLDWTVTEKAPARFRIQRPDGRIIATRDGRRSVQGWIASVRVAGWPRGLYLVTAEAGASRSSRTFILD